MRVLSRGGGTVDSGSSNVKYYKLGNNALGNLEIGIIVEIATSVKQTVYTNKGKIISILPMSKHITLNEELLSGVKAIKIDYSEDIINCSVGNDEDGNLLLIQSKQENINFIAKEFLDATPEQMFNQCGLIPITKEEFYDLNNI